MLGLTRKGCHKTVYALLLTFPCSSRSPDLSPIEHIYYHLGWRVGHLTSLNEQDARLQQIWNEISQDIIQNLYASMPDRIASCIRARGGSTGVLINPCGNCTLSYTNVVLQAGFRAELSIQGPMEGTSRSLGGAFKVLDDIRVREYIQSLNVLRLEVFIHQLSLVCLCVIVHKDEI
ncbi:transposable element Tcb2 transposase [Trichonephila clavipes]|uniref:Transposable element Tcb2 transposase n=1 Tax=Trichonephila clavipes TaxID=2585209 RepID=A0A8X6T2M8_TRICX|nr:transposable element Tcb2 transposase [Trichonephila clavipes]